MDPTLVTTIDTIGPWYVKLMHSIGPLAATLFLFLGAFAWLAWRISIAVTQAWHLEGARNRDDIKFEREQHRTDIDHLVNRLDERDKFQREELMGIVRGYEKNSLSQINALTKIENVLEPLAQSLLTRPCMLLEQKREILEAVKIETQQVIRKLEGAKK